MRRLMFKSGTHRRLLLARTKARINELGEILTRGLSNPGYPITARVLRGQLGWDA